MKLFTGNKIKLNIPDRAASGIANVILKSQNWFAASLQCLTKNWKQKQQWIFLYLICLIFGTVSILAIVRPFKTFETPNTLIPSSISTIKKLYTEDNSFLITKKEVQHVQEYKRAHPNLLKERPGLYDSLSLIEQVYYSQQK